MIVSTASNIFWVICLCIFAQLCPSPGEGIQWLIIVTTYIHLHIQGLSGKKSNHCYYDENSLCNINAIWQPRRVDWNAHASTMTASLYQSVGVVDTVE